MRDVSCCHHGVFSGSGCLRGFDNFFYFPVYGLFDVVRRPIYGFLWKNAPNRKARVQASCSLPLAICASFSSFALSRVLSGKH